MTAARTRPPWTNWSLLSRLLLTGIVLLLLPLALPAAPANDSAPQKDAEIQARAAQKSGRWLDAVRLYDDIIRGKDKPSAEVREAYQECLRRYYLQRRHNDHLYRDAVAKLTQQDAIPVLEQILDTLSRNYYDHHKTELAMLLSEGVQELLYALDEEAFTKEYLTTTDVKRLDPFRQRLLQVREELKDQKPTNLRQAGDKVIAVARDAHQLGAAANVKRAAVIFALEIACGACNSLDEYSLFMTPFHWNALRGKYVGVGVDLAITDHKLLISHVYPNSPAAMAETPLAPGDQVLRIDGQSVTDLPPDVVAERLLGPPETFVDLDVQPAMNLPELHYHMMRRAVATTSVEYAMYGGDSISPSAPDIGYIHIRSFQDSTADEVKDALARLQTEGMKGLILDLRGNPGGMFKAAIQVSELFLGEGTVIVFTQGQLKEFNKPYKVENGNPFQAPVVVLVDGDTASSAEILAGALKDHGRAKLFGQTTFGKGSIQQFFPLDKSSGGIRVTVAKFSSPLKNHVSGTGIQPNQLVAPTEDPAALAAQELRILLSMKPPAGPMPMMPSMSQ